MTDWWRGVDEEELPKQIEGREEIPPDWEPSPDTLQAIGGETDEELLDQVQAERERLDTEVERDAEALKTKFAPSAPRDVSDEPQEPEPLKLGEEVAQKMDTLWQKSVQNIDKGVVNEYAATLVERQDGELKLVNPVEGTRDSVTPNLDIAKDEEFVGTFHTHPYEDGTTTAFSDQDIAAALETQEKIGLVRSGDETYALTRTDLTPEAIDADEVREAFDQEVLRHMDDPNISFSEAVYLANIETCRRYGLAFYKGKGGNLTEVYRP